MPGRPDGQQAMWDALAVYPCYGAWVAEIGDALAGFLDLFVFPERRSRCAHRDYQ
jgi:hypothetical protein